METNSISTIQVRPAMDFVTASEVVAASLCFLQGGGSYGK